RPGRPNRGRLVDVVKRRGARERCEDGESRLAGIQVLRVRGFESLRSHGVTSSCPAHRTSAQLTHPGICTVSSVRGHWYVTSMDISPLIVIVALGLAALLVRGQLQNRRRRAAIRSWAQECGWDYSRSDRHLGRGWNSPAINRGKARDVVRRTFPEGDVFSYEVGAYGGIRRRHITGINLGL